MPSEIVTVMTLNADPAWRLSARMRDVIAEAKSMGLAVRVFRGAGLCRPRRWIRISGSPKLCEFLEADHPWIKAPAERRVDEANDAA